MSKAASKSNVVAMPVTVRFDYLNETPGAWRYQEHSAEGTPLVGDADGAKIGALYLRKAAFPVAPKSISVVVS